MPLKTLLKKLHGNKFKRIYRSYIAPIENLKVVINKWVQLTLKEVPVSDSYIGFINELMKN